MLCCIGHGNIGILRSMKRRPNTESQYAGTPLQAKPNPTSETIQFSTPSVTQALPEPKTKTSNTVSALNKRIEGREIPPCKRKPTNEERSDTDERCRAVTDARGATESDPSAALQQLPTAVAIPASSWSRPQM